MVHILRFTFNFQKVKSSRLVLGTQKVPQLAIHRSRPTEFSRARGFEGCPGGTIPAHPRKKSKSYGANLEKVAKTRFNSAAHNRQNTLNRTIVHIRLHPRATCSGRCAAEKWTNEIVV